MSWTERGAVRGNSLHGEFDDVTMADNTLYCSRETGKKVYRMYKNPIVVLELFCLVIL